MNKYFQCSVKYRKVDNNGTLKQVTESYLVDALSYSEAERKINDEVSTNISGEFKVTNIKTTNYAEVHPFDDCDYWFKSKVSLTAYDEESGKEKKTNIYLLVQANDVKDAHSKTVDIMRNTMGDYSIPMISETKILDFFPHFEK